MTWVHDNMKSAVLFSVAVLCVVTMIALAMEEMSATGSVNKAVVTGQTYFEIRGRGRRTPWARSNVVVLFRNTAGQTNSVLSDTGGIYRAVLTTGTYNVGWITQGGHPPADDPFETNKLHQRPTVTLTNSQVLRLDLPVEIMFVD